MNSLNCLPDAKGLVETPHHATIGSPGASKNALTKQNRETDRSDKRDRAPGRAGRALLVFLAVVAGHFGSLRASEPAIVAEEMGEPKANRPNILLIMVDDLGYGDLSSYGAGDLQTPNVDGLVAAGIKWNYFYANCPVCSPTRASLMTGRYPELVGVPGVIRTHAENSWGDLRQDVVTLPQALSSAGYDTAMVGKWHLGLTPEHHPNQRGFEWFKGFLGDMMDDYFNHRRHGQHYMQEQQKDIFPEGHATDLFSDWACDYLRTRPEAENPFFLYLAYNAPHTPIQPPSDWLAKVEQRDPGISEKRAKLVALIEHMDHGIGQVLDCLKETGLDDNTLVVFTSDNGGQVDVGGYNGGLRDGKQSMYEGGLRVACCAVWPGVVEPGTETDSLGITMDLYPTLCEIAGVEEMPKVDGISLRQTLAGEPQETGDRELFFHRREGGLRYGGMITHAVIRWPWKLLKNTPFEPYQLYRLDEDPHEQTDLLKENRQQYNSLARALRLQLQRGGAVPWQPAARVDD